MLNISDFKKQISLKFIKKIIFTLQIKSCNIFAQIEIKQKKLPIWLIICKIYTFDCDVT